MSKRTGERVLTCISRYLKTHLKLVVNTEKSGLLFHNNLKGASDRYRSLLMLNIIVVLLVMSFIAAYSASQTPTYTTKVRVAEALTKISTAKAEISTDYFYFGHWPKSRIIEDNNNEE